MKRSYEPIFWAPFGAGGVLSALIAPILILVTGILAPLGIGIAPDALAHPRVLGFAQHWIGKLAILAVISLFLFHAVHRIYHGLHEVGIHGGALAWAATYGAAIAGTILTAWLLLVV